MTIWKNDKAIAEVDRLAKLIVFLQTIFFLCANFATLGMIIMTEATYRVANE